MADQAAATIREKNGRLLAILFHDKIKGDVTELLHASQRVETVVKKVAGGMAQNSFDSTILSYKIFQRSLAKVDEILTEYLTTMLQIEKDNQLNRFLNNTNLRRKIEQLSSSLVVETNMLEEKYVYLMKDSSAGLDSVDASKRMSMSFGSMDNVKQEEKIVFKDPEAQQMWEKEIGSKVCCVCICLVLC